MRGQRSADAAIDLGLAISALSMGRGDTRTHEEIAAFCGCTRSAIQNIEFRAMRKLRKFHPELVEQFESFKR